MGEQVEATPRKAMTAARRARIIAKHDGRCAYPGCIAQDRLEIDHVIPIWLGGKEVDENLQPLCFEHHKQKSRLDAKIRAKVKRLTGGAGNRARPLIPSRGFNKALTRGFDGCVRPRI